MDSWAHKEASNVTKVSNLLYDTWGNLLEGGDGPPAIRGSGDALRWLNWLNFGEPPLCMPPCILLDLNL